MNSNPKYITAFNNCIKRKCFIPFTDNGKAICRLYELGQCKGKESAKDFPLLDTEILKGMNNETKN